MPAGDARGIVHNHHYDPTENINIKYSKIPHEVAEGNLSSQPKPYLPVSDISFFVCTIYWLLVLSTWFKDASLLVNFRDVYGVKPDAGAREMIQTPLRAPAILQHP